MAIKIADQYRSRFKSSENLRRHLNADPDFWKSPIYQTRCIIDHLYKNHAKFSERHYRQYSQIVHDRIVLNLARSDNELFELYRHLLAGDPPDILGMTRFEIDRRMDRLREVFFCSSVEEFLTNVVHRSDLIERICYQY